MRKYYYMGFFWIYVVIYLFPLPLQAQTKTEDLGNVWIITIDKSGSMKDGKSISKFERECSHIISAIDKFRIDTLINFNKDCFFVYHTGLFNQYAHKSLQSNVKIAEALSSDSSFTDLFIHPYKSQYRSFPNYRQLKNLIITSLLHTSYVYKWSFVSQIRITALDRSLKYLSQQGNNKSYNDIYILTITDDADANDQWKNDYRVIKSANRVRLEELNELQEKYIYNRLTGRGNGELEELFEDDKQGIHAYLYKYRSKQQLSDDTELAEEIVSHLCFRHVGANKIKAVLKETDFPGISVVYWQIDTIEVNGKIDGNIVPQKYSIGETELSLSEDISNLRFNRINVVGKIQVLYQDSILGSHYKDIPFYIQGKYIASHYQHKSFVWLIYLLAMVLICFFVYYFLILPKSVILSIYLPDNRMIMIKHGYKFSYPSQVPLLLQTSYRHQFDYLVNNNSYISIESRKELNITDKKILVVSRVPLNLENPVFIADVYNRFIDCSSEMSDALKYDYSLTIQNQLVKRYNNQSTPFSGFTRWLFDIVNMLCPRFYYEINPSEAQMQYTIESPLRSRTLFLIDLQKAKNNDNPITEKILRTYYSNRGFGEAGAVISIIKSEEVGTTVDICLIEQKNNGVPCISNVSHIYHYVTEDEISGEELVVVVKQLKKLLHKTICVKKMVVINKLDDHLGGINDVSHFNVAKPVYSRFIMFVEANEKRNSQLVYSPFAPYCKFVSLHSSKYAGYLYDAIIPMPNIQIAKLRRLSNDIVHISNGTIQRLEFEGGGEHPTTIVLGQNKINIEVSH